MKPLIPNYRNLATLHNWLLDERHNLKDAYSSASWESTGENGMRSAFGWAKTRGPDPIGATDKDWQGMTHNGLKVYPWAPYMARVFGLSMGMTEYCWIDSCRWRQLDDTIDGAIARIRFVIDNALSLKDLGELVDVLNRQKPLPYDILENRRYDLSKTI